MTVTPSRSIVGDSIDMLGEYVTWQAEILERRLESGALAGYGPVRLAEGIQIDVSLAISIALADLDDLQLTSDDGRRPDPARLDELKRYIDWLFWVTSPMVKRVLLAAAQLRTYSSSARPSSRRQANPSGAGDSRPQLTTCRPTTVVEAGRPTRGTSRR